MESLLHSNTNFESLLRKIKLSEVSIQKIKKRFKNIQNVIASDQSVEQIAIELNLDRIDKLRLSKIMKQQGSNDINNDTKTVIVSTYEQQAINMLYKQFENVSNVINNLQFQINDLNKCFDSECHSIQDYFDHELLANVMKKKNELLSMIDQLSRNKYEILQNQLKNIKVYTQQLNDAKLSVSKVSHDDVSMIERRRTVLKYHMDLCSNNSVPLYPVSRPMIQFDINTYLKNINNELWKHIVIDDLEQPDIVYVTATDIAVHSMNICWNIKDELYDKLKLKNTEKSSKKSRMKQTEKNMKETKKKCKLIFQVSWKATDDDISGNKEDEDYKSLSEDSEEGSYDTNDKKRYSKYIETKPTEIASKKRTIDDDWSYSNHIYDSFSFLLRFLDGACKYMIRIRCKYRKSKEWGVWCQTYVFSTIKMELKWSHEKCNNNPEPKFDSKHGNKVKIREDGISKVGVEYVVNAKKYDVFELLFKIDRFYKSNKHKGAVYLGFMTSNIDSKQLKIKGYHRIPQILLHHTQPSSNTRKLNKRNVYYKVPLGNMTGFEPVIIDPFAYCIEIKEGKSKIKIYTAKKQGKEIDLMDKVSVDDMWRFVFKMNKEYCLVYRNDELVMNKKYFKQIPNAICPVISNSRHRNACTVIVSAGKCKRKQT